MIYETRKSLGDLEIGKKKKALSDFTKKVKDGGNWKEKQYQEKDGMNY